MIDRRIFEKIARNESLSPLELEEFAQFGENLVRVAQIVNSMTLGGTDRICIRNGILDGGEISNVRIVDFTAENGEARGFTAIGFALQDGDIDSVTISNSDIVS